MCFTILGYFFIYIFNDKPNYDLRLSADFSFLIGFLIIFFYKKHINLKQQKCHNRMNLIKILKLNYLLRMIVDLF